MEVLAESRDDEQRVVDTDADPDHRHEDGRDRVDRRQPGEDEEQDERRCDGDERERDRDGGGDEGPEDEQEDDERGEEAEKFLRPLLDRRELGIAVELDDDPGGRNRLAYGVLYGDDARSVRGLDDVRELRLRIGDAAVVGEGALAERVTDAVEADLVRTRGELRRLELRDGVLDRGLALGGIEPLALGSGEDQVEHGALLGGELGLDEIRRLLRVRARDLELVLQAPTDGRDEQDQDGDDAHPAEDHRPRVVRAPAHPARQAAGREPFVCREMVLLFRHVQTPRLVAGGTTAQPLETHRSRHPRQPGSARVGSAAQFRAREASIRRCPSPGPTRSRSPFAARFRARTFLGCASACARSSPEAARPSSATSTESIRTP